jgi:dienelactone hydrolase
LQPKFPIDIAAELKAPVLGLYGAADQGIPVESVERMAAACKAAGKIDRLPYTQEYIDAGMPGWPSSAEVIGSEIDIKARSALGASRSRPAFRGSSQSDRRCSKSPKPRSASHTTRIE